MEQKIAIHGIEGSFHQLVAREYYGAQVQVEECMSFPDLVNSIVNGNSTEAVMAIENSIAGSILPNYALIDEHDLRVIGEYYMPIHMNLMALPGQQIEKIKKVYSHPMALLQCKEFFTGHRHIKLIEDEDTAEVARRIARKGTTGVAALASKTAAEIFGLEILAEGVHTKKSNSTRFLILSANQKEQNGDFFNKASLKFELESRRGSLASILNILRDYELDMTKIQSMPIIETPWKYSFFADVLFEDLQRFSKAMEIIEAITEHLKILGIYKNRLL